MKKLDTYYTTLKVDVFRTGILIIVTKNTQRFLDEFPLICRKLKISYHKEEHDELKQIFEDYNECIVDARTCILEKTGSIIIVFNNNDISEVSMETLIHEMYHTMKAICGQRGIDDEETEAYLIEHLFNAFLCAQDDYEKRKKQ